jgi:hypothetical protein
MLVSLKYREDRNYGNIENIQIYGRLHDTNNRVNFGFEMKWMMIIK